MEFDKSRVYTALNADDVKPGSKVILADDLSTLRHKVEAFTCIDTLTEVNPDDFAYRFVAIVGDSNYKYMLCYLVSEPNKPRLMTNRELAKWLAQGNGQWRSADANLISMSYSYGMYEDADEVLAGIMIRGWNETKWHEPEIEVNV